MRIDDCIFDAVLVHLRILNWLVVNSPKAMEQRIIQDLHRGIDGHFQISQNRMGYDEIETKTGNLFPTLNGQSEPLSFYFILNSLIQNESNLPK